MNNKKKLIEVCDECWTAACWYGEFMCQRAAEAGTVLIPVGILEQLSLEDFSYWSETKLVEVYGTVNPGKQGESIKGPKVRSHESFESFRD